MIASTFLITIIGTFVTDKIIEPRLAPYVPDASEQVQDIGENEKRGMRWAPRQKKYFEVGSCSNLGDAQARRLKIRVKSKDKGNYFAHTLNNTVVAPPRMLIAFLENNLCADGSVKIPEVLRKYMGGIDRIVPNDNK